MIVQDAGVADTTIFQLVFAFLHRIEGHPWSEIAKKRHL